MDHSFDIEFAKKYGVNAAILYRNFQYWIAKNKANGHNFRDGRTWTYNSMTAFAKLFPYLSLWDIRKALKTLIEDKKNKIGQLERKGILLKANYNTKGYDRTTWYTFKDEKNALRGLPAHLWYSQMDCAKSTNGVRKSHTPIPNPIPDTLPDTNKPIEMSRQERLALDLQIAKEKKFLTEQLEQIFHLTTKEKRTFARIIAHLVKLAQQNPKNIHFFKDAVEWAKQAKASNGMNKKGLFVAKIKQETGFRGQKQLLRKNLNSERVSQHVKKKQIPWRPSTG